MFDLGNTPEVEAIIQEQMANTDFDGPVRVPHMLAVISGSFEGDRSALIMERLNATNLRHAINGTRPFPEGFDLDDFMEKLEAFINHMHNVEMIAHHGSICKEYYDRHRKQPSHE